MSFLRALDEVTGSTLETLRLLLSCLGKNIYYYFAFLCVRSKIEYISGEVSWFQYVIWLSKTQQDSATRVPKLSS